MTNTNNSYLTVTLPGKSYKVNFEDLDYLISILNMFESHNGSEEM